MPTKQWGWFCKPHKRGRKTVKFHSFQKRSPLSNYIREKFQNQHVFAASWDPEHFLWPDHWGWPCPVPHLWPTQTWKVWEPALVPLEAAHLPSAASSTPDIRWWGAWWIHPSRNHSDRCTLHHPWSLPFGLEGHWWPYTGLAFAPGAEAVWKGRKTIIPWQENSLWKHVLGRCPLFWVSFVSVERSQVLSLKKRFLYHVIWILITHKNLNIMMLQSLSIIIFKFLYVKNSRVSLALCNLGAAFTFSWVSFTLGILRSKFRVPWEQTQTPHLCFKLHFQL